jgi:glutamate formiminotransferase/glutamate formiminotransferase/formiminotetrahydrofolate cyclodeaminase
LLAVPNFSEGRDADAIAAIVDAAASAPGARLLDRHSDPDHDRTVLTLAGPPGSLHEAVVRAAAAALHVIELTGHDGVHPWVGAIDVAPIVFLHDAERGAACAEALTLADRLASELELAVFLYGVLTGGAVSRADVRRGGQAALRGRVESGELRPDYGPHRLHPRGGAVLVAARAPLVAFNVELAPPADLRTAKLVAARIREGGEDGLPTLRAIGVELAHRGGVAQVSMNLEDHTAVSLAQIVAAISRYARPLRVELVGLAPRAAFDGFPDDLPVENLQFIEDALGASAHTV